MSLSKLINLTNVQQLIDLNEDLVNFKLEFKILSENNTPFNAVVATQVKLDSGEPLEFKNVENGSISGNIIADNGVKQNYYLVLKSEIPTKCKLEINIQEIPLNEKENKQQQMNNKEFERYMHSHGGKSMDISFFNSKTFLLLSILVGGLVIYYLFYVKQNNINTSVSQTEIISSTPEIEPIVIPTTDTIFDGKNSRLLSKINDITFY